MGRKIDKERGRGERNGVTARVSLYFQSTWSEYSFMSTSPSIPGR
jgi:hypothetical protein